MGSHTETTPEAFSEVAPSNGPTRLLSHFHIMGTDKRKSIGTENSMQSSPVPFFVVAERHENCIVTPFRLNNTAVVGSSIALTCNWSWSRVLMAMNISVMLMLPRPGWFLGRETLPGPCARSVSPKGIICPVVRVGIVVPRCGCYVAGNICKYVAGKLTWPPCTVSGNVNLSVGLLPGLFLCRLCGVKFYTVHFWIHHVVARFVLGSRFIFAASDAIDHSILFTRLEYTFGIHSTAFAWFKSCQRHAVRSCQIILWCPSRFCPGACSLRPLYYPSGLHHQPSQFESSLLCRRHSAT